MTTSPYTCQRPSPAQRAARRIAMSWLPSGHSAPAETLNDIALIIEDEIKSALGSTPDMAATIARLEARNLEEQATEKMANNGIDWYVCIMLDGIVELKHQIGLSVRDRTQPIDIALSD